MRRTPVLALIAALCLSLLTAAPALAKKGSCGRASGCTKFELIHAGSTYGWYPAARRHEFKTAQGTRPPAVWQLTGRPEVWAAGSIGHGTLMTRTPVDAGDVYTDWRQGWTVGRWETRFRSLSKRAGGSSTIQVKDPATGKPTTLTATDAKIRLELVPVGSPDQRCGATSILLAGYDPADTAHAAIGVSAPDASYATTVTAWSQLADLSPYGGWTGGNTKKSAWHVWAVELRPTFITWFLDGKVVRRAPRPASTRTTAFSFREAILGSTDPAVHTAASNTQMDWARYWTLKRTTKKKAKKRALSHAPVLPAIAPGQPVGPC